jgi:uncharacterized protein (DUF2141 family)
MYQGQTGTCSQTSVNGGRIMSKLKAVITTFFFLLVTAIGCPSWAATISGVVSYSGAQTGRVHLMLAQPDPGNGNRLMPTGIGTSLLVAAPGNYPFTLLGAPIGSNFQLLAFMDTANPPTGYANGASPLGNATVPEILTSNQVASNITVSIMDLPPPYVPVAVDLVRDELTFDTFSTGFIINWKGPENAYGMEIADSYDIYWSTSPNVGPGTTVGGGSAVKKAIYDNNFYIVNGLNAGTTYYVAIRARLNGLPSQITQCGSIIPSAPAGTGTITGTVNISFGSVPTGRTLYVVASNTISGATVTAPVMTGALSQTYTITNVPPGTYALYALYDVDQNNYMNDGDLVNSDREIIVTVPAAVGPVAAPLLALTGSNSFPRVVTGIIPAGTATNYSVELYLNGLVKHPAHIVFNNGPNVPATSIGIGSWGNMGYHWSVPRPIIGDQYTGTVTYTDNTTEPFTVEVTGLIGTIPVSPYPVNQISGTTRLAPTFSWRPTDIPAGNYSYHLRLSDYSITNGNNRIWAAAVDMNSQTYKYDGPALVDGRNYNWNVTIQDSYGNTAQNSFNFTPTASPLSISSISPAVPTAVGVNITINGAGFSPAPNLNTVSFNGFGAGTITSASNARLTLAVPNSAATGLVTVTVNGITAASPAVFSPTAFYDSFIVDKSDIGIAGVTTKRFNAADKTTLQTVTSIGNGNYKFTAIATGKPFYQSFTPPLADTTKAPTFSRRQLLFNNFSSAGPADRTFVMFDKSQIATWGTASSAPVAPQQTGKAMIRTTVRDSSNATVSGAVVHAFSTKYGSARKYTVAYANSATPADETILLSGAGSATQSNGTFYILNIDPDDVVIVTASRSGWQFNVRTFDFSADTVSEGSITGVKLPTITSFTPSGALPGGGATINITGSGFTSPATLCFQGSNACVPASVSSSTQILASVPCGAQSGVITLTTGGNSVTSTGIFTVPAPTITGFTPTSAPANDVITITGTNFPQCQPPNQPVVKFSTNQNASVLSNTPTSIMLNIPLGAVSGPVSVTTSGGTATGNFTVIPSVVGLALSIVGNGSATETNGSGFACASGTCNQNFSYGTTVSFSHAQSNGSIFQGWSGACIGTGNTCSFTMDADKTLTATFLAQQYLKIGANYYSTVVEALAAAASGNEVLFRSMDFIENITFSRDNVTLTLKGGYDTNFSTVRSGTSSLHSLIINKGTLKLDAIRIR